MVDMDITIFTANDLRRLIDDVTAVLRFSYEAIARLARHEIQTWRLMEIRDLEKQLRLYKERLVELALGEQIAAPKGEPNKPAFQEGPRAKIVILFCSANPRGVAALELPEECAAIQREISLSPYRDDFHFESRWAVGIDELMRHLMTLDPDVIHFSGHGGGAKGLLLQDESAAPLAVSARALALIVKASARRARLVLLNACYSEAQAEALRGEVDCVVGMGGAIGDTAARIFATRFYGALGNRRSIGNAVAAGVAALAAGGLPEELFPRCLTREGLAEDEIVLFRG